MPVISIEEEEKTISPKRAKDLIAIPEAANAQAEEFSAIYRKETLGLNADLLSQDEPLLNNPDYLDSMVKLDPETVLQDQEQEKINNNELIEVLMKKLEESENEKHKLVQESKEMTSIVGDLNILLDKAVKEISEYRQIYGELTAENSCYNP